MKNKAVLVYVTATMGKKYDVLSPDGISIHHEDFYDSPEAAKIALTAWVKRYERQGYYSSIKHGRIPLEEIENYCSIVPI